MKILFLTSRLPYPPNRGDKLRVFNLIKGLSKKHSVTLLSFIEAEDQLGLVDELKKYCSSVEVVLLKKWQSYLNCLINVFSPAPLQVAYYYSGEMRKKLQELNANNKFDAVYAHLFRMAHYAKYINGATKALDLCDAVSLHLKRTIKFNRSILWPVYLFEWLKIKRYEKIAAKDFDRVLLISNTDKEYIFGKNGVNADVNIVNNGVDYEYFKPVTANSSKRKNVSFLGYLGTFYNIDAILNFYDNILPIIKKSIPDITFTIIGADWNKKLDRVKNDACVEVISNAEDTRPLLDKSSVFVCPLRVGSGQQNKILEAMAMGLPVVTMSIGYDSLQVERGREIFVEDKPDDFAARVIELLNNAELRNSVSRNARRFIENNYSWESSVAKLEGIFMDARLRGHDSEARG
ncbi:MAG: glycosyltransferase [Candidatus Omnitrophota bacterium]